MHILDLAFKKSLIDTELDIINIATRRRDQRLLLQKRAKNPAYARSLRFRLAGAWNSLKVEQRAIKEIPVFSSWNKKHHFDLIKTYVQINKHTIIYTDQKPTMTTVECLTTIQPGLIPSVLYIYLGFYIFQKANNIGSILYTIQQTPLKLCTLTLSHGSKPMPLISLLFLFFILFATLYSMYQTFPRLEGGESQVFDLSCVIQYK